MGTRNASVDPQASLVSQALQALAREGPLALARRLANYARWATEVRLAALVLRAKARRANRVEETLDLIEGFKVGRVVITAWQVRSELGRLLEAVQRERPRVVLEIGTALGGTLFGFALLGGHSVDFLFVDGDHEYEGVRKDCNLYGPLVRPGGLIAFHDIVPGDEELVGGVPRFWEEFKRSHETIELVESWDQRAYGIGVVRVDGPAEVGA